MPKTLAAVYALLIALQVAFLVDVWQLGLTAVIALAAAGMGFEAGLAAAIWMDHTIRG